MKKIIYIFLIVLLMGCSKIEYKKITAKEAKEMIEKKDVIILDVRTEKEYKTGHLKNSINIPLEKVPSEISKVTDNKEKTIIIYCRSGSRAIIAAEELVNLKYENVYTFGGIDSWEYNIEY